MQELTVKNKVRLDYDKFSKAAQRKNLTQKDISRKLYKGDGFVCEVFKRYDGWIKERYLNGFCEVLECTPEDILYIEPSIVEPNIVEPNIVELSEKTINLTADELKDIIYTAVYAAVKKVWDSE